jgi:hypothetical protein
MFPLVLMLFALAHEESVPNELAQKVPHPARLFKVIALVNKYLC